MRLGTKAILSEKTDIKALELQLRVEAKRANQRLRQLEKSGIAKKSFAWKHIRNYSQDGREFTAITSNGEFKFKTSTRGRTREELQKELIELEKFLYKAKTSTVKGTIKAKKNLMEAMTKNTGDQNKSQKVMDFFKNMTEDEFDEFWDRANLERLYHMYGSDDTIDIIESAAEEDIDMDTLNRVLEDIKIDEEKSIMSIMDEVRDNVFNPTGEVK